ncbi:glycine cleavage system protein GcvH [Desulfobaculum bizertense]|uniref:glycine cleavage system protein GcvH n=1 Tax=Desulfobaculum bizertense TaxID=376490 RepID=UPI001F41FA98|nr:glycine cleavage system protein GcvH [Desulfobaculum bizertense]UIJ38131.1 glycine cleavage system protein GcvH [Desulfobaculum bizertense]
MIPQDLLYSKSHEWARIDGEFAYVGITHFAQEQLGDLTYVELPEIGDTFDAGAEMGSVESVKAASEIYAPVSGKVVEINESLEDAPEKVNQSPYEEGWLVKIKLAAQPEGLMNAADYEKNAVSCH